MRKYTAGFIQRNLAYRGAGAASPFPGKNPLRMWWKAGKLEYNGKFTIPAFNRFMGIKGGKQFIIYDKAGAVITRLGSAATTAVSDVTLFSRYFPTLSNYGFFDRLEIRLPRLEFVQHDKKGLFVDPHYWAIDPVRSAIAKQLREIPTRARY